MKTKKLHIDSADGHRVPATRVLAGADRIVVLSHGITTGRDEDGTYTAFAEETLAPRFDSVRFDFRGHGDSKLKPRETTIVGEVLDLMAVLKWAREQGYKEVFHLGTSFGASVTLLAARRFDLSFFRAVTFWNPVVDYDRTFIHSETPWAREFYDQKNDDELAYRPGTKIPETKFVIGPPMTVEMMLLRPQDTPWPATVPLLVVHGDSDTAVPYQAARDYCQRNPSTAFHLIPGVDHGFDAQLGAASKLTTEWFLQHSKKT